uniref:Secreted protein n=1 Tax=Arundo donax TaxID=35708 RepID=A0A0A9A6X7_ARUDO
MTGMVVFLPGITCFTCVSIMPATVALDMGDGGSHPWETQLGDHSSSGRSNSTAPTHQQHTRCWRRPTMVMPKPCRCEDCYS